MKYIKGNIVVCDDCGAHVLIESQKEDTFTAWNYNRTCYNRYATCPSCQSDILIESNIK